MSLGVGAGAGRGGLGFRGRGRDGESLACMGCPRDALNTNQ